MATADTARLIASLEMDTRQFQAGASRALGSINRIDRRLGAFSGAVNRNLGRLVDTAVTRGTQLLVDGIKGGVDSLATLEDATTSVDGAIKQMGLTGQVTAAQIAQWANEIEAATDAAFDDKDITRNATTLLRYGRVTTDNLHPALEVMTDLAAKTGSVDSAASKLARSLADPTKATRVLREVGVTLTKEQEKQIKSLVKQGKLGKAQAIILREVGKATKDAARDSAGPFRDMQNTLNDTVEDAQRLLAVGAFPVLQKLGDKFKAALADPQTMKDIEAIGRGAAGALDKVIEFAEKVPWGQIRDGLGTAARFAGDIVNAFASMPPEVQGTIIALAGLNKLSGGAVSGIISELGKGLIKGVLGMTAGVVNLKAGVVNGGGGPGVGPEAGAGAVGFATLLSGTVAAAIGTAASGAFDKLIGAITERITPEGSSQRDFQRLSNREVGSSFGPFNSISQVLFDFQGTVDRQNDAIGQLTAFLNTPHPDFLGDLGKLLMADFHPGMDKPSQDPAVVTSALQDFRKGERDAWTDTTVAVRDVKTEQARAAEALGSAIGRNESTTRSGTGGTTAAVNAQGAATRSAIAANRPIVNVELNVSPTSVEKNTTIVNRYGPTNGSAGGGNNPLRRLD